MSILCVQETADYTRPVVFNVDVEMQNLDNGPVLDDGWSTSLRVEVTQLT